jgi:hypothetical protein
MVDDGATDASIAGSQFAEFILNKAKVADAEMAAGLNMPRKKEMKQYPPFRQTFFQDTRFLPALAYTHICYEFDAQFGEMDKHWSHAGKKFSDEPARGKPMYSAENGPKIPVEWPQFAENEKRVFGAKRKISPFSTSKRYTTPADRCTLPYRPTLDEAESHLGPGRYMVPDVWTGEVRSNDGNVKGTQAFLSRSPSVGRGETHWDRVYREEPMMSPERAKSSEFHRSITGSFTRTRTPADYSRSVLNRELLSSASQPSHVQAQSTMGAEGRRSIVTPVKTGARPASDATSGPGTPAASDFELPSPGLLFTDSLESGGEEEDESKGETEGAAAAAAGQQVVSPLSNNNAGRSRAATADGTGTRAGTRTGTMVSRGHSRANIGVTQGALDEACKADYLSLATHEKVQSLQYLSSSMKDPSLFKFLVDTQFRRNAPGKELADEIPHVSAGERQSKRKALTVNEKNKIPGVSIGKGTPGKSSLDIITGSTDADINFKRLVFDDGKSIIYKLNKDSDASNMPEGACFTDSWGNTQIYAEKDTSLAVEPAPATMNPPSPKKQGSIAGPAGVIGKLGPIWVEKTRPVTASVAHALPSNLSGPKTQIDPDAWLPPKVYKRAGASTPTTTRAASAAAGTRARNQIRADQDFPLRGFPAHLKHRLKDSPHPNAPTAATAAEGSNNNNGGNNNNTTNTRASTAGSGTSRNTRGILAAKNRARKGITDALGTTTSSTPIINRTIKRQESSQILQSFFDQDDGEESFVSKFEA